MTCLLSLAGWCLTAETIPESGAIVAGVENEANILIQCEVRTSTSSQRVTTWFIMRTTDAFAIQISSSNPDFTITGDPVPNELLLYNTNLTILTLTADFDQAVVFCGETTDRDLGNFTIRIIRKSPHMSLMAHRWLTDFVKLQTCSGTKAPSVH